jgi:hypothetical protein
MDLHDSRDMEACGWDDGFWEEIGLGDLVEGHHSKIGYKTFPFIIKSWILQRKVFAHYSWYLKFFFLQLATAVFLDTIICNIMKNILLEQILSMYWWSIISFGIKGFVVVLVVHIYSFMCALLFNVLSSLQLLKYLHF